MIIYFFSLNQCLTAKMVRLGHKNKYSLRARTSQKTLRSVKTLLWQPGVSQSHAQVLHRAGLDYITRVEMSVCVCVRVLLYFSTKRQCSLNRLNRFNL